MVKQKCLVCGRQMHKYNERPWGQKQAHWKYICAYSHTKYVPIAEHSKKQKVKEKVFNLESLDGIEKAEEFKFMLENEGYEVITQTIGFSNVKVKGVK